MAEQQNATTHLRSILAIIAWTGILLGFGATAAGAFAPIWPYLELVNHFRPFLLIACGAVVLLALAVLGPVGRGAALTILLINLALGAAPLLPMLGSPADGGGELKVVSFNLWIGNRQLDDVERVLRERDADIIVLQELSPDAAPGLLARLSDVYPHSTSCGARCGLALLSKTPWLETGSVSLSDTSPALIWASFPAFEMAGVHLAYPFQPERQQHQIDWLIDRFSEAESPLILAGDFNLTPFSWKLNKLAWQAGLRPHLFWAMSWHSRRDIPAFVLLDNVLTRGGFSTLQAGTAHGPGSDHRLVDVTLRMPGG